MEMDMQQMTQQLLANAKANQDILARMEANRESDREQMVAEISTRMDANTKEMNAKMDTNQAKMISTVIAFRSELKETIQH
jgi:hypothetical protein